MPDKPAPEEEKKPRELDDDQLDDVAGGFDRSRPAPPGDVTTLSNLMKKVSDSAKSIIQNLRG